MLIDRSSALERGSDGGTYFVMVVIVSCFQWMECSRAMSMGFESWCDGDTLSYCDVDALELMMAMNREEKMECLSSFWQGKCVVRKAFVLSQERAATVVC